MDRLRTSTGLAAVGIGTAWLSGSFPKLVTGALAAAPYVLVLVAVLTGARAIAPTAGLTGPCVLLLAGVGWIALRNEAIMVPELGTAAAWLVVIGGFAMALSRRRRTWRPDRVRRNITVLTRRSFKTSAQAPVKLAVTTVLGTAVVTVENETAKPANTNVMELDLSVLLGRIELHVPTTWKVLPGRFIERAIEFDGNLDDSSPVSSSDAVPSVFDNDPVIVINVLGLAGAVAIRRVRPVD